MTRGKVDFPAAETVPGSCQRGTLPQHAPTHASTRTPLNVNSYNNIYTLP